MMLGSRLLLLQWHACILSVLGDGIAHLGSRELATECVTIPAIGLHGPRTVQHRLAAACSSVGAA